LGRTARQKGDIEVDYSCAASVNKVLNQCNPAFIINLVALTNVDACESNPHLAYIANVGVIERICRWMKNKSSCHLIHISTDHVYDGLGPHAEDDISIVNYYGLSKYAGELAASLVPSTILRTNFFGRSASASRDSFSDWVYSSLIDEKPISVFEDVFFSPLSISSLVNFIYLVTLNPVVGVFNLGSRDGLTKADFVYFFAEVLGVTTSNVSRCSYKEYNFTVPRPSDMRMNSKRFEAIYTQGNLPTLEDEIISIKGDYCNEIR
jgi:dTDP-4-dehydrorhamnose reductase